ncbi:NAC domain-containing protein 96-like [Gastrolobium bilobum]|uniref:NAC domain-containing protein 96-like n=1 Tax=Gastrolobium bilobum TaxID=150636 RepID=UPI002AAFFA28|nr:NAC domain-containing protein 96-like [Gastrolobium bilobum]
MVKRLLPLGYRFHPYDHELVGHYLKHKLLGDDSSVHNEIAEVDVCKFEPWDLPAYSKIKSDDPVWYFFSPLSLKFRKSTRRNRKTKTGYWKVTGKDRNIKTPHSNNVIGTKKTLVFYKSCGGHRVKTNWVIHEYHAVTFPDDKRGYVLCRLKEKAEKNAEVGTDSLIHDEGEPSSHIIADYENQPTTDRIPDVYTPPEVNLESVFLTLPQSGEFDFSSLQQSPIVIEQDPYFQASTFPNACFGNENSIKQAPFKTTVDEGNLGEINEFWHSFIIPSFANDSTPSQSLRKDYHESFETEAEPLSARHGNVLNSTSTVCNEDTGSRENPVISMVKSSHDAGPSSVSSKNEVNLEKKDSTFDDNFWGEDADFWEVNAFDDSTANESFPMFLIESVSPPSPPRARSPPSRRCKSKYHQGPRSSKFTSQRATSRSQAKSQAEKAVSQQEAQKETHILESNKEQRKAQGFFQQFGQYYVI